MSIRVGEKLIDLSSLVRVVPEYWSLVDVEPCFVNIRPQGTSFKGRIPKFYMKMFSPHFRTDIYYDEEQKIIALMPLENGNFSVKSGEVALTKLKKIFNIPANRYFARWIEENKMLIIDLEAPLL